MLCLGLYRLMCKILYNYTNTWNVGTRGYSNIGQKVKLYDEFFSKNVSNLAIIKYICKCLVIVIYLHIEPLNVYYSI